MPFSPSVNPKLAEGHVTEHETGRPALFQSRCSNRIAITQAAPERCEASRSTHAIGTMTKGVLTRPLRSRRGGGQSSGSGSRSRPSPLISFAVDHARRSCRMWVSRPLIVSHMRVPRLSV